MYITFTGRHPFHRESLVCTNSVFVLIYLVFGFKAQLIRIYQFILIRDSWLVARYVFNTRIQSMVQSTFSSTTFYLD